MNKVLIIDTCMLCVYLQVATLNKGTQAIV